MCMKKCPAPDKQVHLGWLTGPTDSETQPLKIEMQLCSIQGCGFDAMSSRRAWHQGLGQDGCVPPAGSVPHHTHTCSVSVITELQLLGRGWPEDADRSSTDGTGAAWQETSGGACAGVRCGWVPSPATAPTPLHMSVSWVALSLAQPSRVPAPGEAK